MSTQEAKRISVEELLRKLSSGKSGLSAKDAKDRLQKYGPNDIPEKKVNPFIRFLKYFWGPIPWMIEIAAVLSAVIHHWEDVWIITALLLLNAVVGFWQENKADNAIELLKQKLALKAHVCRDGKWQEVDAQELVRGDVVRIRLGDIVPADIKLMNGNYLLVDESALTGESLPAERHVSDVAYAGSIIRQGEMDALVVATGLNSYFGKTARLVEEAGGSRSHFQKAIIKIGDYLIALAVSLVAIMFLVALFRHESILETLQFALVLIVAAIPVALPAVLTVTMAVGATALAKKEAIVSRLVAIEEMAGMDVLCSDKTGTITKNELTTTEVKPFQGFVENDVLVYGTLASRKEHQDPIDNAIISKAESSRAVAGALASFRITNFHPFDPISKRAEATIENAHRKSFKVSKGAPQVILALVANKETDAKVNDQVDALAAKGYRSLGVARTDVHGKWQFVGIIPLYDPPREDSAETIKTAQSMGVQVKMVTGDHIAIAKEIASEMKLGTNILPSSAFLDKPDREAERAVENADGFAEVFPEHKYRIVELLQAKGHIVGMTGDGVNDAPALKESDAGIAVAGATDAAKSAADIVLTKPGLSVIIDAIKESRKIFQRMDNYSIYRIAETIRVLFFITFSIIVFGFYPVTALMIVLLALLNDAPIMTIAFDNVKYSNQPEKWNMRSVLGIATFLGLIGVVSSFLILYIGQDVFHLSREVLQSFIYLKLSVAGHLTVLVARTKGHFWSVKPAKQLLAAVIGTQTVATLITVYGILLPAMGWGLALFTWAYALIAFVITDLLKLPAYRLLNHSGLKFDLQSRLGLENVQQPITTRMSILRGRISNVR
jgi:H+-transporting ATPase